MCSCSCAVALNGGHKCSKTNKKTPANEAIRAWHWMQRKSLTRTCLRPSPQCSLISLSIPHAIPRNHQKLATIANTTMTNRIFFVCSETRWAVKTKWSSMCMAIVTAKWALEVRLLMSLLSKWGRRGEHAPSGVYRSRGPWLGRGLLVSGCVSFTTCGRDERNAHNNAGPSQRVRHYQHTKSVPIILYILSQDQKPRAQSGKRSIQLAPCRRTVSASKTRTPQTRTSQSRDLQWPPTRWSACQSDSTWTTGRPARTSAGRAASAVNLSSWTQGCPLSGSGMSTLFNIIIAVFRCQKMCKNGEK